MPTGHPSRRQFLSTTAATAAALVAVPATAARSTTARSTTARSTLAAAPAVATASRTFSEIITGEGDYKFRVHHAFPQLPDKYSWQTTHNVALDKAGNLYVIHE